MWTDDELAKHQAAMKAPLSREAWPRDNRVYVEGDRGMFRDLYRLARLGLEAEKVGRGAFLNAGFNPPDQEHATRFTHHPAWAAS